MAGFDRSSVGGGGALLERVDRQSGQALSDDPAGGTAKHLAIEARRIIFVEDRGIHLPTRNIRPFSAAIFSRPRKFSERLDASIVGICSEIGHGEELVRE